MDKTNKVYPWEKDALEYFLEGLKGRTVVIGANRAVGITTEAYDSIYGNKIEFVIVNKIKNTTVVKFKNGRLGKVKCQTGEKFDVEKGIVMAILKALTNFKELNKILGYFDKRTASKIEKGLATYMVECISGKEAYAEAIENAQIIEKEEKEDVRG